MNLLKKSQVYILLFVFSFLLYGNTLQNKYALDDAIVITQNQFVKKGFSGISDIFSTELFTGFFKVKKNLVEGGRYRPLSLVSFAIEYEFFGQNPFVSHLINILLYALSAIILYLVLFHLFRETNYYYLPLLASLLWIAHPIHTEAVANIKGRDEILALLASLYTVYLFLRYTDSKKKIYLIMYPFVFFLALLSKETSITFLAIVPLSLYYFTSSDKKNIVQSVLILLIPTIVFLYIRQQIIGAPAVTGASIPKELMNDSFLGMNLGQKYATIFFTLILYIKLLFIPYPLTYDYYPYHIHILDFSNLWVIAAVLFHLLLAVIAFKGIKKKTILSFGILYYAITLSIVSNLLFSIGAFMNERFVYMPSVGWAVVLAYGIIKLSSVVKKQSLKKFYTYGGLVLFILPFTILTIYRNPAWANDYILFTTDVKTSFDSAKSTTSAGGKIIEEVEALEKILRAKPISIEQLKKEIDNKTDLRIDTKAQLLQSGNLKQAIKDIEKFNKESLKKAIQYLNEALKIHPTYSDALLLLGNAHYKYNKDYEATWAAYEKILKSNPRHDLVAQNWSLILNGNLSPEKKIIYHQKLLKYNPYLFENTYQIGNLYGQFLHQLDSAIVYLEKAKKLNPNDSRVYKDLGVAYGINKNYSKALEMMLYSIKLKPLDYTTLYNIALTYNALGNTEKAKEYFAKGDTVKSQVK
jgi:tetratricopeptide (TPR) repeat protein